MASVIASARRATRSSRASRSIAARSPTVAAYSSVARWPPRARATGSAVASASARSHRSAVDGAAGRVARERGPRGLLVEQQERVLEPDEDRGAQQRALDGLQARLLERDQGPGQVPAVDRRDVARPERRERRRVVPVVEVAVEA